MISILIVEDDDNKLTQLSHHLHRIVPEAEIATARSLQSGLRSLKQTVPSLVVLDMTLPNYDASPDEAGGQTHPFGGREFLSQIDRFDIQVPVIVVTQFETFGKAPHVMKLINLDAELRNSFPRVYCGAIYYHAAVEGWQEQLTTLVQQSLPGGK
jgi:CheY-like chemotaxis protein